MELKLSLTFFSACRCNSSRDYTEYTGFGSARAQYVQLCGLIASVHSSFHIFKQHAYTLARR